MNNFNLFCDVDKVKTFLKSVYNVTPVMIEPYVYQIRKSYTLGANVVNWDFWDIESNDFTAVQPSSVKKFFMGAFDLSFANEFGGAASVAYAMQLGVQQASDINLSGVTGISKNIYNMSDGVMGPISNPAPLPQEIVNLTRFSSNNNVIGSWFTILAGTGPAGSLTLEIYISFEGFRIYLK